MNLMNIDESVTMSSLEIAEITGKEHFIVLRDVRDMLNKQFGEGGEYKFVCSYKSSQNKDLPMYNLRFRETMILMAGYNQDIAAAIVDRWLALERENKLLKEHMAKMVSYDLVLKEKMQTAKELAARNRAEDEVYKLEKIIYKYIDKASDGDEVDKKMYELKFETSRFFDSQELIYSYQAQCETLCQKLIDKDELVYKLVGKREFLKLGKK